MKKELIQNSQGKMSMVEPSNIKNLEKLEKGFHFVETVDTPFGKRRYLVKDVAPVYPKSTKSLIPIFIEDHNFIGAFFTENLKRLHEKMDIPHKLNVLIAGKEGSGKTSVINAFATQLVETHGAVVIDIESTHDFMYIDSFIKDYHKYIDKNQLFVRIFDECEGSFKHDEAMMKRALDSAQSAQNCVTFFTTNYLDLIPNAIKNRPSRIKFTYVKNGIKDEAFIYSLLKSLNDQLVDDPAFLGEDDLKLMIREMMEGKDDKFEGYTLDEIKHTFTDQIVNNQISLEIIKDLI